MDWQVHAPKGITGKAAQSALVAHSRQAGVAARAAPVFMAKTTMARLTKAAVKRIVLVL